MTQRTHFPSMEELQYEFHVNEHFPYALIRILVNSLSIEPPVEVEELLGQYPASEDDIPHPSKLDFFKLIGILEYKSVRIGVPERLAYLLANYYMQKITNGNEENYNAIFFQAYMHYHMECCKHKKKRLYGNKVSNMMEYIESHAADRLSLTDMAQVFHYNPSYMCQKYRAATGQTIYQYYMECKLGEAQTLLSQTERSIGNIASYLQFSSQSHFQRAFHKAYGITPAQFRQQL